jgi:hypothetical protein
MEGIALSDSFDFLIRKIGWSVGLENTLERVLDLVELYISTNSITATGWRALIHDKWELKQENITDFFVSLGLLIRQQSNFLPGELLDGLATASLLTTPECDPRKAVAYGLLQSIIEQDGDIFLNCLSAEFRRDQVVENLHCMIEYKRACVLKVAKHVRVRERVLRAINIDYQPTNKGSAGGGDKIRDLGAGLKELNRSQGPFSKKDVGDQIVISDDYLRKAPGRRKGWAQSVGLVGTDGGLTTEGQLFLEEFENRGHSPSPNMFCVWPTETQLQYARIDPSKLGVQASSSWQLCEATFFGLAPKLKTKKYSKETHEETIQLLRNIFDGYQSLNQSRSMLRRELPIGVAFRAVLGISYAENSDIPSVPTVIENESLDGRRIELRRSRTVEGAYIFRKE